MTAVRRALKPNGRVLMNPAAILTMTIQGHAVDPAQAEIYAAWSIAKRTLTGIDNEKNKTISNSAGRRDANLQTIPREYEKEEACQAPSEE